MDRMDGHSIRLRTGLRTNLYRIDFALHFNGHVIVGRMTYVSQ